MYHRLENKLTTDNMKTLLDIAGILLLGLGFILIVSEPDTLNLEAVIWKTIGFALAFCGYHFMMATGKYDDNNGNV